MNEYVVSYMYWPGQKMTTLVPQHRKVAAKTEADAITQIITMFERNVVRGQGVQNQLAFTSVIKVGRATSD